VKIEARKFFVQVAREVKLETNAQMENQSLGVVGLKWELLIYRGTIYSASGPSYSERNLDVSSPALSIVVDMSDALEPLEPSGWQKTWARQTYSNLAVLVCVIV